MRGQGLFLVASLHFRGVMSLRECCVDLGIDNWENSGKQAVETPE